uniref:MoaB/Mog domain-containing protein n=1 Tax=Arcella intermedia TaxID=1963864 RepID=A0A6B2L594_9EUKA
MVEVPAALALILEQIGSPQDRPKAKIPTAQALGLILAEAVCAPEPLPPFPASVVDGYAVVAEDGPGEYTVEGIVSAGAAGAPPLRRGTVVQITTGSPVPEGADAVVMVEDTDFLRRDSEGKETIRINKAARPGQFVRRVGSDIASGMVLLSPGDVLGPSEVGLLATAGAVEVVVYCPPVVAVLSTGDELVEPGETPKYGQIRDSNRSMLIAALKGLGFVEKVVDLGIGVDNREALQETILKALQEADVLITSGGVSMGEFDLLKPILEATGKIHFGRILMKPGKPFTFATLEVKERKRMVFGLPGNPVSSIVTFQILVVPALRRMSGWKEPQHPIITVKTANPLKLDPERPEYHRATTTWNNKESCFLAETTGIQESSRLLSMKSANTLLLLPQQAGTLPVGSFVQAYLIGPIKN